MDFPLKKVWQNKVWPVCQHLFEGLIHRPFLGLVEIGRGLGLAVPELATAIKEAIEEQLSPAGRARVMEGMERLVNGWLQVRWALAVAVLVVVWGWTGLVLAVGVGSLMAAI